MKITLGKLVHCNASPRSVSAFLKKRCALLAIPALAVVPVGIADAQVIQGTTGDNVYHNGYISDFNDISVISGSATIPTDAIVFCVDGSTHWPGFGVTHQYTVSSSLDFLVPQGSEKAVGLMNYVIENYFEAFVAGGSATWGNVPGYQMNLALWEITGDYDGTRDSLSSTDNDPSGEYSLFTTIVNDLWTNYDSISSDYRSTKYDLKFLVEEDGVHQSLLMISPVPEPSAALLLGISAAGMVMRRRRRP